MYVTVLSVFGYNFNVPELWFIYSPFDLSRDQSVIFTIIVLLLEGKFCFPSAH